MRKRKLVYIVSDIDKALAFEWTASALKVNYDLSFILIGRRNTKLQNYLMESNIPWCVMTDEKRFGIIINWFKMISLLWRLHPDIVHVHLWRASLLGLTASWVLRIKKRIYTRHHATTHYREFRSGRKWDRVCNFLATDIVAISKNTKEILLNWDKAKASKVKVIPHGFDFDYLMTVQDQSIAALKIKYNLKENYPVIGVISRYLEWKGIHFIIPAFKELRLHFPNAHLVLANAQGDYKDQIRSLLGDLPPFSYTEILFEYDLAALYKLFDIFVHVPIDGYSEAFGQTYVEALASGVPSIFTMSGIAHDFIEHEKNALVVPYKDSTQIFESIRKLLNDSDLRKKLVIQGKKNVYRKFALINMIEKLEALYTS